MIEKELVLKKAALIRLLICDVDGVLTDGKIWVTDNHNEHKTFHCHDGMGFKMLEQGGIQMAVLSSRTSPAIVKRMLELNVPKTHILMGQKDKLVAYRKLRDALQLQDSEIAYIGDDLPDLPVMREVGLSIAVANATPLVLQKATWQTTQKGGEGAVRETCELLLLAQNKLDSIENQYSA